jgi:transposase InsO family protein
MGLGRYVVDAIVLEGRSPSELARSHHISRSWIYELLSRYRAGGYGALEPRSRRPRSCAHQVPHRVQAAVVRLRRELSAAGHDAGPQTIAHHLARRIARVPSIATIWRILQRHGLITPQPHKRPRSSFTRFEAQLPNEMWQADTTHWSLADGTDVEILNLVDDHSRLALESVVFATVKAADVVRVFFQAGGRWGLPASFLSDNGAVFSGGSRGGTVLLESELARLGIRCMHSTPNHPQTCGKVERFHQTLKRFLAHQPRPRSTAHLQLQLDSFRSYYNQRRPHRALDHKTPLAAFNARLKAKPELPPAATHFRVRQDKVDGDGRVTLRYLSRLRHIYVGRTYRRERVRLLVADAHVRVVHEDGRLLGELTLDAQRDYQPMRRATPVQNVLRQVSSMS